MSIKKLGVALVSVVALAGILASSAFATAIESPAHWRVNVTTISGSKAITCAKATGAGNFEFAMSVFGGVIRLEAAGIECLESTISNSGGFAIGSDKLKFTGVKVVSPVGCSTTTTITTAVISSQIYMEGTKVYDRFVPTSGTTFVTIPISGCAAAGNYPIKGTDFGLATNLTGVETEHLKLKFSDAINTAAGGGLTIGTASATLSGEAENSLNPAAPFSAIE